MARMLPPVVMLYPPDIAVSPALQFAVAVAAVPSMVAVRTATVAAEKSPAGPCAPSAPAGPAEPCAPSAPVAPVAPVAPLSAIRSHFVGDEPGVLPDPVPIATQLALLWLTTSFRA